MEEKEEIEGRSNNGLKIIYFPLLSREGTKDDYLIWRDEDDAPETTKRPRLSSTDFGLKVDERGQKRGRIERELESERRKAGEAQGGR